MNIIFVQNPNSASAHGSDNKPVTCLPDQVTPQSITYAAVMLMFSLTNVNSWTDIRNCPVDLVGLYYFIVDFFEEPINDTLREHSTALIQWWNL
ncbi:hypothetical protein H0H92_014998, partial [Tricholoma furcatifolium]